MRQTRENLKPARMVASESKKVLLLRRFILVLPTFLQRNERDDD
jgi:hypothetical protein